MSDDVMRLSDLVPEYARHYKVGAQDAAYALYELFDEMDSEQGRAVPADVMWVGRVASSMPADMSSLSDMRVLDFSDIAGHFSDLAGLSCNSESKYVGCTYIVEGNIKHKYIPSSMVYLSKSLLGKLIHADTSEFLSFLFNEGTEGSMLSNEQAEGFRGKELVSVQGLARGLIEMIIEVDSAHRGVSSKINPEAILIAACKLGQKLSDRAWYEALADLARAAEVEDFRSNRKTLERYVGKIGEKLKYR